MSAPNGLIDDLTSAILDDAPIDWASVDSSANASERPLLDELRLLAAVASVHRQQQAPGHWGHLRVLERIGRGGFGEVYRAWDTRLDREVALKLLPASAGSGAASSTSIIEEGRLLARVRHANVVTIHGAEQIGDRIGLWMEYVKGRTLQQALEQDETFSAAQAIAIGLELCHAIGAVHAAGLVHRDIKPHNVMLAEDGRVVLMDFGAGRELDDDSRAALAGTPLYLAPELFSGRRPTVRSDIYSLGVLLFRLLTGTYPVHASTLSDLHRAHERGERTSIRTAAPHLSPKLARIIEHAINPDPERRHASASALADDLSAMKPRATRATLAYALPLAAALALLVWIGTANKLQEGLSIAPASQVLLAELVNGTNEAELDGAGEVLRSQLAQSPHFELLEPERIHAALTRMGRVNAGTSTPDVAREVALREGVPLVVYAALTRLGTHYTMSVKLEHVGARPSFARRSWTRSFAAPTKAGLFETMHDAAVWIRQMAGELPAVLDQQDRAASETTTTSWEALRLFEQAGDLQAAGRVHDATLVLEQAIRIDPEFAMAHTRLGDYLISLRRDKEGFAAWQRAIEVAERRQLTSRETLRIRAQYLDDMGDLAGAEAAYRTYAIHYPNDFYAALYLGASLKEMDRIDEALPWLERALQLRPRSIVGGAHLASTYLNLERTAEAARAIDHVESIGGSDWARWLRALSLFIAIKPDDALAALEPLRASSDPQWRSRACLVRASWLSEVGRDEEALAELRAGIDHDARFGLRDRLADKWLHIAELQRRSNDPEAVTSVQRALDAASDAWRLQSAVRILVRGAHRPEAERLMAHFDELPATPTTAVARDRALGELALGAGHPARAVTAFERTLANSRRWQSRLPFAEALAQAGDMVRAERILRAMVDHPAAIYARPEPESPGLWRQSLTELAEAVHRRDPSAAAELRRRFASIVLHQVSPVTR